MRNRLAYVVVIAAAAAHAASAQFARPALPSLPQPRPSPFAQPGQISNFPIGPVRPFEPGRQFGNSRPRGFVAVPVPVPYVGASPIAYSYGYSYQPMIAQYGVAQQAYAEPVYVPVYLNQDPSAVNFPVGPAEAPPSDAPNAKETALSYTGIGTNSISFRVMHVARLSHGGLFVDLGDGSSAVLQPCKAATTREAAVVMPGGDPSLFLPPTTADTSAMASHPAPSRTAFASVPASGHTCWAINSSGEALIVWG